MSDRTSTDPFRVSSSPTVNFGREFADMERRVAVLERLFRTSGGGGVTDHGALTGLGDDDHPQYLTEARGDALFLTQAEGDARYALLSDLGLYVPLSAVGAANGVASLDAGGKVPATQLDAADILSLLLTVDGPGSGVNADLLDGIDGSQMVRSANLTNQKILRGSGSSGAFNGANPSSVTGTFTFPDGGFSSASVTVIAACSALTGNTTTVVNVTAVGATSFNWRAALVSGASTSAVTIYYIALGPV